MTGTGSHRLMANSVMLMAAELIRRLGRFGLVIASARLLGDERYGDFSFGLAFTSLFLILADLGIHKLIIRDIARAPERLKEYVGNSLALKTVLSLLTMAAIVVIIQFKPASAEVRLTVYILGLVQIAHSFSEYFNAIFQAFQEMKYDAIATVIQVLSLLICGVGVLLLGGGIQELAAAYLFGNVVSLVYAGVIVVRRFTPLKYSWDVPILKHLAVEGLPIGINYFFSTMYTYMDSVMLSWMTSSAVVGWYNAAYRLIFTLESIGMGVLRSVFPALSSAFQHDRPRFKILFNKTWKILLYLGISMAVPISLLSKKIILFLYGMEYEKAGLALSLLIWTLPFIFINTLMAFAATSANRQRFSAVSMGLSAFFNVILNYILIPKYSFVGAAAATIATQGFNFLLHFVYLSMTTVRPAMSSIFKIGIINAVPAGFILLFSGMHVMILGPLSLALNGGMVLILRFLSKEELSILRGFFQLRRNSRK